MNERKPQIHNSHLNLILSCGEKYRRKYIEGEPEPIGTPLVLGISVHAVVAKNLVHQVEHGHLMTDEQIRDDARDALGVAWDESPVLLNEAEQSQGLASTKDTMRDVAIDAAMLHHRVLAPTFQIAATDDVEWKFVIETPESLDYDLAGTADVIETLTTTNGRVARVRDTKFVKRKPNQHEIEQSGQFTVYDLAVKVIKKMPVEEVCLDALIKPTKTMGVRLITLRSDRNDDDVNAFIARMTIAQEAIRKGVFMPANPAEPWAPCGYCGYAQNCHYYTKRPSTIALSPITYEADHAHNHRPNTVSKTVIKAGTDEWRAAISG